MTEAVLIRQLRARYDRFSNYRIKFRAQYDELLILFRDLVPFNEIAARYHVSRERVSQVYREYFAPVCPEHGDGNARRWIRYVAQRPFREARQGRLRAIIRAAEDAGLRVERVRYSDRTNEVKLKELLIQGLRCKVHFLRRVQKMFGRPYACSYLSRSERHQAHILCLLASTYPHHTLVIPTYALAKLPGTGRVVVWIPLSKPRIKSRPQRVDWVKKYGNQWRLLA